MVYFFFDTLERCYYNKYQRQWELPIVCLFHNFFLFFGQFTLSLGQLLILFFMGVIASATMVIPGVSGSMMLMLLGYYNPIIGAISGAIDALLAFDIAGILAACGVLVPFGVVVVVGIFAIAKLIEILLKRYRGATYCAILGLVAASPVAILMATNYAGVTALSWVVGAATLALGFFAAYKLGGE